MLGFLKKKFVIKKLIICPWFGELPRWFDKWLANVELLKPMGYDFLVTTNLDLFNDRCEKVLGFRTPIVPGGGKLHDYRPAFGALFEEELKGYDFWGHTDFDCVYGNVERFLPDSYLEELDVYADCPYICGPWTLYRNTERVNQAFYSTDAWKIELKNPATTGWGETSFSDRIKALAQSGYIGTAKFGSFHRFDVDEFTMLGMYGKELQVGHEPIMMFHFRRTKEYPIL